MEEHYGSIGEAIGAAMAHNIRLAAWRRPAAAAPVREARRAPHPNAASTSDIDIGYDDGIFAAAPRALTENAHQILHAHGFVPGPTRLVLSGHFSWEESTARATRAAEALLRAGFDVSLDPMLLSRQALDTDHAERLRRQQAAATRTSPAAGTQTADPASPTPTGPALPASNGPRRTR
ncbi:hypothetical protein [Actinacidiphila guanduensis]|uniref:Uncharacterized protein n=1 Tax=Actinacidiphila guanduensis TaxID=310781 RepID=A0A1H0SGS7_9ACTN|nr:hypothetical protein [Actinacidiphila guanduensis]SDP40729.1 hypothetical protein SAMN05216259_1289 [Actinacidiphila guanduensis]